MQRNLLTVQPSPIAMEGHYTLIKRNAETLEVIQEVGPFHNVITNLALNRIGSNTANPAQFYVGTGTNPAAATDTSMGTYKVTNDLAPFPDVTTSPEAPTYFAQVARTRRFSAGLINGNITEVGCGWNSDPTGALWSRELIVDSMGNPITLTVLSNEILDVVYTLRYYINTADFTGSFVLNGNTYNYTARPQSIGNFRIQPEYRALGPKIVDVRGGAVTLGPITTGLQGGVGGNIPNHSDVPYVDASLTAASISSFTLDQGNVSGGLKAFATDYQAGSPAFFRGQYQFLLDTPIPKTNANTMTITMSMTWSRYTGPIV